MDTKSFILGILATTLVGGSGYYLGNQNRSTPVSAADAVPASAQNQNKLSDSMVAAISEYTADQKPAVNNTTPAVSDLLPPTQSKFEHFRVGNKNVKSMLVDGAIVWIGTSGGVIRYDTNEDSHTVYDTRSGLLANGIFHLSKLGGQLVAGTYGGGFSVLDEDAGRWKTYNVPDGLADAFVYDMLEMDNGDIWIATWSGVNRVIGGKLDDLSSWETYTVKNTDGGLPNDWVYGLRKGRDGDLWMATEGGLARYKAGKWRHWGHADGLGAPYDLVKVQSTVDNDPARVSSHHARQKKEMGLEDVDIAYNPNYIVSLYVDEQGVVWAGTWGAGLAKFENGKWENFTMVDGLPANHVSLLSKAENGKIWVGTSAGLARFDGVDFTVYTTRDGLFANNVFSLVKGTDGSLWVGSYGGVARIYKLSS